jgi:hypothetical protein
MAILFGSAQFTVVRGTRWEEDITLTDQVTGDPVDLTGIEGILMRVRESIDDDITLELSVDNGFLVVLSAAAGQLGIRVPSADMLDFPENDHQRARYVYDAVIERTADEYEAAISGTISVLPQVTRPWGAT